MNQDYELGKGTTIDGKLTLKSVSLKDNQNTENIPLYRFEYDGVDNPFWRSDLHMAYYDGYDFYNSNYGPAYGIDDDTNDGSAWSLTKVIYPSGGWEEYSYENDYINDNLIDVYYYAEEARESADPQPISDPTHKFTLDLSNVLYGDFQMDDFYNNFLAYRSSKSQGGARVTNIVRNNGVSFSNINYSYGEGRISGPPLYHVPFFSDNIYFHLNPYWNISYNYFMQDFAVKNRGECAVYYDEITEEYEDGTKIIREYEIGERVNSLIYTGQTKTFVFTNSLSPIWGKIKSEKKIEGELVEEKNYFYGEVKQNRDINYLVSNDQAVQWFDLFKSQQKFFMLQQSQVKNYNINYPTRYQEKITDYFYNSKTLQLEKEITNISDNIYTNEILYAHNINEYGGSNWDPNSLSGLKKLNILDKICIETTYHESSTENTKILSSNIYTFNEFKVNPELPDPMERDYQSWQISSFYKFNSSTEISILPDFNFANPETNQNWFVDYQVIGYKYGKPTQIKTNKGSNIYIYYGNNQNQLSNDNDYDEFSHELITGVSIEGKAEKISYNEYFKVGEIENSNGFSTYYNYDDFNRLQSIKINNNADLLEEYSYSLSRKETSDNYNPDDPNWFNKKIYRNAIEPPINLFNYLDGYNRPIQELVIKDDSWSNIKASDINVFGQPEKVYNPYFSESLNFDNNWSYHQTEYIFAEYLSLISSKKSRIYFQDGSKKEMIYSYVNPDDYFPGLISSNNEILHEIIEVDEINNAKGRYFDTKGNLVGEINYKDYMESDQISIVLNSNGQDSDSESYNIDKEQKIAIRISLNYSVDFGGYASASIKKNGNLLEFFDDPAAVNIGQIFRYPVDIGDVISIHVFAERLGTKPVSAACYIDFITPNKTNQQFNNYDENFRLVETYYPNYFEPPAGSSNEDWIIQYEYDMLGNNTSRNSTDTGTDKYRYDSSGNLILSQNESERLDNIFKFFIYDIENRFIKSGLSEGDFQNLNYDLFTPSINDIHKEIFYDSAPISSNFDQDIQDELSSFSFVNCIGKESATKFKSGEKWTVEFYSFGDNGLMDEKWVLSEGINSSQPDVYTKSVIEYYYDLAGALIERNIIVGNDDFKQKFTYNRMGQMETVHADANGYWAEVTNYQYTPAGTFSSISFPRISGNLNTSYTYNNKNFLTDINNVDISENPFASKYTYLPNGIISNVITYSEKFTGNEYYRYVYTYDDNSRLNIAQFQTKSGSSWTNSSKYNVNNITYDMNGNIQTLQRYDESETLVDNLSYTYGSNNKLLSINDSYSNISQKNWDAEDTQISYDAIGNVIKIDKGAAGIIDIMDFNLFNLPEKMIVNSEQIKYRYNIFGQRIYKKIGSSIGEYYLMDGDICLGVFDEQGNLKYWNIYGADLIGRYEP